MAKELSRLDRAMRLYVKLTGTKGDAVILRGDDLLDARALAEQFELLLKQVTRQAEVSRANGSKGGRPRSTTPSPPALAKRKSRAKKKAAD